MQASQLGPKEWTYNIRWIVKLDNSAILFCLEKGLRPVQIFLERKINVFFFLTDCYEILANISREMIWYTTTLIDASKNGVNNLGCVALTGKISGSFPNKFPNISLRFA